jgi:dUTP pyrophosphatase
MQSIIKFIKTKDVKTPEYGSVGSAGLDFFVPNSETPIVLAPGESTLIPSGIRVNIPIDTALIAYNKSGVATKKRLQVGACVVDCDYQGEIHLHVYNTSPWIPATINPGDKLVQFILTPIIKPTILECLTESEVYSEATARGAGGFGSTGS